MLLRILISLALLGILAVACAPKAAPIPQGSARLRVMTFNLWFGGDGGGQPLESSAAVIRAAQADVVGLQETQGNEASGIHPDNGARLAEMLGWHYFDQGERRGILSRFPIVETTPQRWGAIIQLESGHQVAIFNAHLMYWPYQPYQLLNIPYFNAPFLASAEEAIQAAQAARGEQVTALLAEMQAVRQRGLPILLTGDFNEPSHRDWTEAAAQAGLCPLPVAWPTTRRLEQAGWVDAYRQLFPDPVAAPGFTWTPTTRPDDPNDHHDRIDFIFSNGAGLTTDQVQIVGENGEAADIVVTPYPSDHRAVAATFTVTVTK